MKRLRTLVAAAASGIFLCLYRPKTEPPSILPPGEGTWQPPAPVAAK